MIELQMTSTNLDFWLLSRNQSIVSVSPGMQNVFEDRLKDLEAPYDIDDLISNDENCSINGECELKRTTRQTKGFFNRFHRYSGVFKYFFYFCKNYIFFTIFFR